MTLSRPTWALVYRPTATLCLEVQHALPDTTLIGADIDEQFNVDKKTALIDDTVHAIVVTTCRTPQNINRCMCCDQGCHDLQFCSSLQKNGEKVSKY
jgi:hypothetical protein